MQPTRALERRPINFDKLREFEKVDHLQHREDCEKERAAITTENVEPPDAYVSQSFVYDDLGIPSDAVTKQATPFFCIAGSVLTSGWDHCFGTTIARSPDRPNSRACRLQPC